MCDCAVSKVIGSLLANTTYYYRVVAVNAAGISYGSPVSFTTSGNIGVIVSPLSFAITDEDGATASFTVVLNSQPLINGV